jgi:hypothetical protein
MNTHIVTTLVVSPASRRNLKRKDIPNIKDVAIDTADAVADKSPTAAAHFPDGLLKLKLG